MSWARDSIRTPVRQPYYGVLTGLLHAKLIPLMAKTRYAIGYVSCPVFARESECPRVFDATAIGGVARRLRQRSRRRPAAGDRLCRRACGAVDRDPDQPEGGAGHPYGCRGGLCLGAEIPARVRQASAAGGLDRGALVPDVSDRRLVDLRAGDGGARLRDGDLLADCVAGGR